MLYHRLCLIGHSGLECYLSEFFNMRILHLEYRLAPEYKLHAAVEDATSLYYALLDQGVPASRIIMMGDSAGGGLVLLTVQSIIARRLSTPRAVIVISPWSDFSLSGESYKRNLIRDVMIPARSIEWGIQQILGPNHTLLDRRRPSNSPLFGSFTAFPPMFITVGTAEILEDDGKQVADKARREGVNVTLYEGQNLMHIYPFFFNYFPEASDALNSIHCWLTTLF